MWRHALERGLSGLIARQLLDGRIEAIFGQIDRAGALPPERLAKLRAELTANLHQAEADGKPYADGLTAGLRELLAHWPQVRDAAAGVGRAAAAAAQEAAAAARAEATRASEPGDPRAAGEPGADAEEAP